MQGETKRCGRCHSVKDISMFAIDRKSKDGLQGKCRACAAAYRRKNADSIRLRRAVWVSNNEERIIKRNAEYRIERKEETAKINGRWLIANRAAVAANKVRYRRENAEKIRAHTAINTAIRNGAITRPDTCSRCNSADRIEGHHPDYARVLHVVWLCSSCHRKLHAAEKRESP